MNIIPFHPSEIDEPEITPGQSSQENTIPEIPTEKPIPSPRPETTTPETLPEEDPILPVNPEYPGPDSPSEIEGF